MMRSNGIRRENLSVDYGCLVSKSMLPSPETTGTPITADPSKTQFPPARCGMTEQGGGTIPYQQSTSQAQKVAILKAEAARMLQQQNRAVNTRSAYHSVTDPSPGGRFAKALGEFTVGSTPTVDYPHIPSGPWSSSQPRPPDEEPLGFSVNDMIPVGELHEQLTEQVSAVAPPIGSSSPSPTGRGADPSPLGGQPTAAPLPASPTPRDGSGADFLIRRKFV
jgi:hypothetical protein